MKPFSQRAEGMRADAQPRCKTGKPVLQRGRSRSFTLDPASVGVRVSTAGFTHPRACYQSSRGFPRTPNDVDTQGKSHRDPGDTTISPRGTGFIRFSFQRFQALLTLFSKSFSPFPHGTCLLSVSSPYLALGEIYHPIYAPVPRNATRRKGTVRTGLQMTDGTLTLSDALFQETYICARTGAPSQDYNSRPKAPIFTLS